jgi:hypothetical protein
MIPNRPNLISIKISGWLQANKQKDLFDPADAAQTKTGQFRPMTHFKRADVPAPLRSVSEPASFRPALERCERFSSKLVLHE